MGEINKKEIKMTITYKKLKKIINNLEKRNFRDEDMVSFEYIIGSCFPNVYKNIQEKLKEVYTQGYIDGKEDREKDIEFLS